MGEALGLTDLGLLEVPVAHLTRIGGRAALGGGGCVAGPVVWVALKLRFQFSAFLWQNLIFVGLS